MIEQRLLAAMMKERQAYDLFERIGNAEGFSPIGKRVFKAVGEWYSIDPSATAIPVEGLSQREIDRCVNDKHVDPLKQYFAGLPPDVSVANVTADIRELHRKDSGSRLSLALANGAAEEEVQKLWQEREAGGQTSEGAKEESLVDVLDTTDLTTEGESDVAYIKLWPKALNDRLDGGALRGHHVLVFARPETGKTLFAINLCAGFLHQKLDVLYVGNEEPAADIRDRIRGRLLKTSKAEIRRDRVGAASRLDKADLGIILITEGNSFASVRKLLGRGGAFGVVVFDQIRNMRLKSDSRTAELEAAGIEARAIAKEFNVLVVSITQAGDSASNKVYLEMSDVDSSKTGLPASADLMIGVGCDEAMKVNGLLGLSLPKNKLSGIHERFTVSANFATGVLE